MKGTILVIDDDQGMCEMLTDTLQAIGFEAHWINQPLDALDYLKSHHVDTVLTDLKMPGISGLKLSEQIHTAYPTLPVILMTGFGDLDTAVQAIRVGAYDFLPKPISIEALEVSITRSVEHAQLSRTLDALKEDEPSDLSTQLIGQCPAFQAVLKRLPRAARSDMPVLITGETGTGKELIAQALHQKSARKDAPFVTVNCAAIPEGLIESELFGHLRGAFTDAKSARAGLFIEAGEGTLFLDELGELPLHLQSKLLRALQERRIRPVGSDREIPIHCRIIAATHHDLKDEADKGLFRSDLYYRLAVIRLALPPLRERTGDILELAQHFIHRACQRAARPPIGLSMPSARILLNYRWPGNIRELENVLHGAVALTEHDKLTPDDLPPELQTQTTGFEENELMTLQQLEKSHILRVLRSVNGNKSAAAKILDMDRRTLYRRLSGMDET